MAADGDGQPRRGGGAVEVGDGDRAEARRPLAQHRLADPAQDRCRRAPLRRGGADRVARQRRHRGRLGALAADVADHREPVALGRREEVVEVAADLVLLARRAVAARRPRRPATSGSSGGSREACSVWAIWCARGRDARSRRRRRRAARAPPPAAGRRRSKRRPDSALTNEITPSTRSRTHIGTIIAETIPSSRISRRCSSSCAASTISASGMSGQSSDSPVRST